MPPLARLTRASAGLRLPIFRKSHVQNASDASRSRFPLNHTTPPPSHDPHTNTTTTQSHEYSQHGRASHHTRCYQVRPSLLLVREQILILRRSIFEPSGCFVEQPVLQCVQIKTMEPKAGDANPVQRFRVVLSDIRNFIQTMIATSMSGKDI
jgi:hypothetical protein